MEKIDWCDWKFGGWRADRSYIAAETRRNLRFERGELRFLASQDRQYILYFLFY